MSDWTRGFLGDLVKRGAAEVGADDGYDRLSYRHTALLLTLSCLAITAGTYIQANSFACYVTQAPAGSNFRAYLENLCWVEGTVPIRRDVLLPSNKTAWAEVKRNWRISYYQWVPFMLGMQSLLFCLPHLLWCNVTRNLLGVDLYQMVIMATEGLSAKSSEKRVDCVKHIEASLHRVFLSRQIYEKQRTIKKRRYKLSIARTPLGNNKQMGLPPAPTAFRHPGFWLVPAYFGVKLLFLSNCIGQLIMLHRFLGPVSPTGARFGVDLIIRLFMGEDWRASLYFPRVTVCSVNLRHVGVEANTYTGQCTLPQNMLNEKLFICFYFWLTLVLSASVYGLVLWLIRMVSAARRAQFIYSLLVTRHNRIKNFERGIISASSESSDSEIDDFYTDSDRENVPQQKEKKEKKDKKKPRNVQDFNYFVVEQFTKECLRPVGCFVIHILRLNAGDVITSEVLYRIWIRWRGQVNWKEIPILV